MRQINGAVLYYIMASIPSAPATSSTLGLLLGGEVAMWCVVAMGWFTSVHHNFP